MHPLHLFTLLLIFGVLLAIGVPIAFCIALSTMAAMIMSLGSLDAALSTMAQVIATTDYFVLLAIPFFILAGQIMNRGGSARRIIALAQAIVGPLPGGLAFVNIISAMLFGALSGSAVAAASGIGGVMAPHMDRSGYARGYSAAVNITASTTGLIIPPSNILIVYALVAQVSVGKLFVAGYVPGILVGLALMIVAGAIAKAKRYPTTERVPLLEAVRRFISAAPSLGLIIVVIGGIVGGVFTATEAAAVAVLYAAILACLYREMRIADLPRVLLDSATTTAVVMLLVATSRCMSQLLTLEHLPSAISGAIFGLSDSPIMVLILINLTLLVVGIFMDITPAVLIFGPIFLPITDSLGIDRTHFGIIMVLNLCIGLCTPPVGSVLFVGCGVGKVSMAQVVRPLLPFYLAMIAALLLVTYFPALSLALPRFVGY